MTEKLISLEQEPISNEKEEGLIDVSPVVPPKLPQETVNERSLRYHYTLGDKSPGPERLQTQINSFSENLIRKQIALDRTLEEQEVRMDVLNSYMQARDAGKPLTKEDVAFVQHLIKPQPVAPESIVERTYAEKVIDQITTMDDNPDMQESYDNDPDFTMDAITVAQQNVSKTLLARKLWEDMDAKWKETGFGTKSLSYLEAFVPFLDWYRQTDVLKETDAIWQGGATQEQIDYIYSLPLEEFHTELKKGLTVMWDSDPLSAFRFLDAVINYSSSDAVWDTTFNAIDIASVVPVATIGKVAKVASFRKAITKKAKELGVSPEILSATIKRRDKVKKQLKDIGIASADNRNLPSEVLSASGRIEDSADIAARQIIRETIAQKDPRGLFNELAKRTTSLLDVNKRLGIPKNKGRFADAYTNRLVDTMERNQALALGAIAKIPRVQRQTLDAETAGLEAAKEQLKLRYRNLDDSVIYWNTTRATDQITNNSTIEMVVGRPDGGIFRTQEEARNWARNQYKLPPGSYRVDSTGVGYTVNIAKDVDETDVRSFLVTTENTNPVNRFSNYWLNKIFLKSGAKEKVSLEQRADRALTTHAMTALTKVAQEMTEEVGNLTKSEITSLNTILDYNRMYVDPKTGDIGKYFNTLDEFQTETNRILGRAPTLRETQAYFTIVQLNDMEYMLTNLTLHAHKTRQGMEMYRFDFMSDTMAEKVTTKFEGKLEKEIPWDDGTLGGIAEITEDGKVAIYHRKESVSIDEKDRLQKLIDNKGYKVVRVAAPDRNHFGPMGLGEDTPVNFVLLKNMDSRPLRLTDHIPYKPGGHADYVDEWWVKQPKFLEKESGQKIYKGDRAVFNFKTQAEAKQYNDAMSRAQFLLRNNMLKEFDEHVEATLPFRPRELEDMYMGKTLEDGTFVEPIYDLNVPFVPLRSSSRSVDEFSSLLREHAGDYEDLINSPYNMYKDIDKRHTGRRDPNAWTVSNKGTPENPDHHLEAAKMLDPLKSTYQSLSKTIRSQFYEDYQIKSVESWVEQYADILLDSQHRPGNKKHLYADIRNVLKNPNWRNGADPAQLEGAMHMRDAIIQMLGVQSHTANQIDGYMQRLASYAFESGIGERKLFGSKIQEWIPNNKMQYVTDPFKHMRAMAFHSKLGFFNPVTWFVQMQGLVPLMSIAGPQRAFKGGGAAYLHMLTSTAGTPEVLKGYAQKATGFGWKAEEWSDARQLLKNSGFDIIGGSHAYLDDMASPKIFQGKAGRALDAGAYFFRNSEGFIRNTAFYTAYEEALRSGAIRVGKVNNRQLASILNRAENLALNMTRNANSSWQQGLGSTMTQFWGYQTRTFELLWGRNLSKQEKARLFVGTSAIYGLPVGLSSAVMPVWPLQESIRQAAIENGHDPDSGVTGVLLQGAPQLMLSMILGEDYNIAERWGPGGLEALKTAFEGDFKQAVLDLGMGASGSILGDIIGDLYPMVKHAMYIQAEDDTTYGKVLVEDAVRAARNISSINNLVSLGTALGTGRYLTKNDTDMGPLDTVDAILKSATGLTPNHIQDQHLMNQSVMNRRDRVNAIYSAALPDFKRYQRAMKEGDMEAAERHLTAVKSHFAVSMLRPDEEHDIIKRLFSNELDVQGNVYSRFHDKGDIAPENMERVQEQTRDKLREIENR